MKYATILLALFVTGAACAQGASAPAKPMTAQQQKMGDCAKQNKGKKGDDYKQGMSSCMSADAPSAPASATQQQKMSDCAKQNKGKKGDDYKNSMRTCLAG